MDDSELLEQHRLGLPNAREAFAELVHRHIDWIYSVARRRVRDGHLAEDVTQAVFMVLFTKPPKLKPGQALSLWLFSVVSHASQQAMRTENRRRRRETEVAKMRNLAGISAESSEWDELAPQLDEMVRRLSRTDRQAVLLRFYEKKSFAEVGAAMGISEEAARKRAERAIEKLRSMLVDRGATAVSGATFGGLLMAGAAHPAPSALAAQLISTVISSGAAMAAAGGNSFTIAKGVMTLMAISKIKLAAVMVFAGIILIGGGVLVVAQVGARRGDAAATQPAAVRAATGWRNSFERVYHLDPGEIVRRIAPPFIPERDQYLQDLFGARGAPMPANAAPNFIYFRWRNNRLEMGASGQAHPAPVLSMILKTGFAINPDHLDGPAFLLEHPVSGDLIIRDEASDAEKMNALAKIVSDIAGGPVNMKKASIEREVFVVSGDLRPEARSGIIKLSEEENAGAFGGTGGGGFGRGGAGSPRGTFATFLNFVGQRLGMALINESKLPDSTRIQWQFEGGWGNSAPIPDGPDHDTRLAARIQAVSAETGMTFTQAKRKIDVWQITPAEKWQPPPR